MVLQVFDYIDNVINILDKEQIELENIREEVEEFFDSMFMGKSEGYININSRVKGSESLKEKILRNNYYSKGIREEELIYRLSDLIGVRLECRFIKDEDELYLILKENFNIEGNNKFNRSFSNENIFLEFSSQQPQKQKNGFKIYRIDGYVLNKGKKIPFELQIKSLVNIFWGEIEHKIIYKNNSYMLIDDYLKDIMKSIKKNLSMIDHQLLATYNQFGHQSSNEESERKEEFEKLLSKIIYDAYAVKMKKHLGFVVDFKKPCDTIMKYVLRGNNKDYSEKLMVTLGRINEIHNIDTKFNEEILFERDIVFRDEFCEEIGNKMLEAMNMEFQWNLFFRIIFEIEKDDNAGDLINFVEFYRDSFKNNKGFLKLNNKFTYEESEEIKNNIMNTIAKAFINKFSMDFLIEERITSINLEIESSISEIYIDIRDFKEWQELKGIYLDIFYIKVLG
ncbi:MAG: GTP pyrophosphokinase, partial [Clostridium sp.]